MTVQAVAVYACADDDYSLQPSRHRVEGVGGNQGGGAGGRLGRRHQTVRGCTVVYVRESPCSDFPAGAAALHRY